ncbi:hybrid sensor histidine kinase/response regulator [Puteibacter caeruleilacunae]|nr:hybrid sensor histidine kinase/response regulator [Puteibacter caeruleilacunae]
MKKLRFLFILVLLYHSVWAQHDIDLNFIPLSTENAISCNSITCFFQAKSGEIWIGTTNGLNRFDGNKVHQYYHIIGDRTSLAGNYIYDVEQDENGVIWIATGLGLCKFNPTSNTFKKYYPIPIERNEGCFSILLDNKQNLWIGTNKGLLKKHTRSDGEEYFEIYSEKLKNVSKIFQHDDENLILFNWSTLFQFSLKDSSITFIGPSNPKESSYNFRALFKDSKGRTWAGGLNKPLYRLLKYNDGFVLKDTFHVFKNKDVRCINEDHSGNLWIGTSKGMDIIHPNGKIKHVSQSQYNPNGLGYPSIVAMMKDKYNSLWIGTFYGGAKIYRERNNLFHNIFPTFRDHKFTTNVIRGMSFRPNGDLWVGTEGSGAFIWNQEQNRFQTIPGLSGKNINIHSIDTLANGNVLLGTYKSGVIEYDHQKQQLKNLKIHRTWDDISSVKCDKQGDVWITTMHYGLTKYDKSKQHTWNKRLPIHIKVHQPRYTCIASDNLLYICNGTGITVYDSTKDKVVKDKYATKLTTRLRYKAAQTVYEDSEHNIWIGSEDYGLYKYDLQSDTIINITTSEGLSNNSISGIIEDNNGLIWVTTENGLNSVSKNLSSIKTYNHTDGLPSNQFIPNCISKDSQNNIYMGTVNGLTVFNPNDVSPDMTKIEVVISDIKWNNEQLKHNSFKGIPFFENGQWNDVHLSHDQNSFTISYTNFYFGGTKKLKFAYRLVGVSKSWIETSDRTVNYNNLAPGEYTFEVKATNPDGRWNPNPTSMHIVIHPPFWKTNTAIMGYVILFIIIVFITTRVIRARIRLRHELKISKIRREKEKEANNMKLRFFTNISHEFRTPLSLIAGPVDNLYEIEKDPYKKKLLEITQRNSKRLLNLINNLLDFRKAEQGFMSLDYTRVDISTFAQQQLNGFAEWAQKKNISMELTVDEKLTFWTFDKAKIASVFYNLLSNAIKYTPEDGCVELDIQLQNGDLLIQVTDNGKGISPDEISSIFDRYYQSQQDDSAQLKGSGIGLALTKEIVKMHNGWIAAESIPNQKTTFTITLPPKKDVSLESNAEVYPDQDIINDLNAADHPQHQNESKTILLVEDNEDLRTYLSSILQQEYQIKTAENGQVGLELLADLSPDLIISDVMMPVMDGITFCKKVKSTVATSHIPFIILSAKETIRDQITGLESGANAYIPKPFHARYLKAQIKSLLDLQSKQHEALTGPTAPQVNELNMNNIDSTFLKDLTNCIEENLLNTSLGSAFLAEQLNMSKSTFYRKITAVTGKGSTEFIRIVRLQKAVKLMHENKYSIAEIADMVGFSTQAYFATCFKKEFSVSPKIYIKEQLKQ